MYYIRSYYKDCLVMFLFMLVNLIAAISGNGWVIGTVILVFTVFFLSIINELNFIKMQIYFLISSTFVLDYLWIFTQIEVPLSLRFYVDIISIILFFKTIRGNKIKSDFLKDPVIIIFIVTICMSLLRVIYEDYTIYNLFLGLRTYFRWIILYICISKLEVKFVKVKNIVGFIYLLQVILVLFQSKRYADRDQICGTFGLYGTPYILCFICIIFYYVIYNKRNILSYFVILSTLYIIIFGEIKVAFIVLPISILCVYIIISKNKFYKKVIITILITIVFIASTKLLGRVYSNFNDFFTVDKVIEYFNYKNPAYDYGRVDNFLNINNELNDTVYKYIGKGLGYSVPSDFTTYDLALWKGRNINQLEGSKYYLDNRTRGYEIVSLNVFFLDNGIIGILVLVIMFSIFFVRAIRVYYKTENEEYRSTSLAYISFLISFFALCIYTDCLYNIQTSLILWIFTGYINNIYKQVQS
ncbi:hypothetical protein [Inconstantimicrobium mannanitabidum]|uniref:Uncharacterized protein n=1 Tax=Inconstantimicrobium mannanitabidum TaxID=1604901 RepID=A0ACB5REB7_9CLOT|nr:hypothetical protein [Clostridium sp. TW13]GKX67460.1 hypothetical protein rsdtw13_27180 [Clostridium sp. TW13]